MLPYVMQIFHKKILTILFLVSVFICQTYASLIKLNQLKSNTSNVKSAKLILFICFFVVVLACCTVSTELQSYAKPDCVTTTKVSSTPSQTSDANSGLPAGFSVDKTYNNPGFGSSVSPRTPPDNVQLRDAHGWLCFTQGSPRVLSHPLPIDHKGIDLRSKHTAHAHITIPAQHSPLNPGKGAK